VIDSSAGAASEAREDSPKKSTISQGAMRFMPRSSSQSRPAARAQGSTPVGQWAALKVPRSTVGARPSARNRRDSP
jgi:hypothetical protein